MTVTRELKALGRRTFPAMHARWQRHVQHHVRCDVQGILAQAGPPDTGPSERDFNLLQTSFPPVPEYGYDAFSTWKRGVERAVALLELSALTAPGRVLEVGAGDGMAGKALAVYGHAVTLADMEDWRDPRARDVPIVVADLSVGLPLETAQFDLAYSYNSLEHILDPARALAEMVRTVKPGGIIYLEFGPLYASPWGLHAYRSLLMPYPQYLLSARFIDEKLDVLGISDLGRKRHALQPLNGWRIAQYEALWQNCGCDILRKQLLTDPGHLDVIRRYPQAFRGRGLTFEDVVTRVVCVTLQKR